MQIPYGLGKGSINLERLEIVISIIYFRGNSFPVLSFKVRAQYKMRTTLGNLVSKVLMFCYNVIKYLT